eukprot:4815803-Amphidinium_carterae.1
MPCGEFGAETGSTQTERSERPELSDLVMLAWTDPCTGPQMQGSCGNSLHFVGQVTDAIATSEENWSAGVANFLGETGVLNGHFLPIDSYTEFHCRAGCDQFKVSTSITEVFRFESLWNLNI